MAVALLVALAVGIASTTIAAPRGPDRPLHAGPPLLSPSALAGHPGIPGRGNATTTLSTWPGVEGAGNLSGLADSLGPPTNATLWTAYAGPRGLPPSGIPAASSPVVDGGLVFVGTGTNGGVLAFNATTGQLVWSTSLPFHSAVYGGLLATDRKIFVPVYSDPTNGTGVLYALNMTTGALEWSTSSYGVRGPFVAPPNLIDGTLVEADDGSGDLYGWNESGAPTYNVRLGLPVSEPISLMGEGPDRAIALAVSGPELFAYDALTGGSYPGIAWSPYVMGAPINGSAAATPYTFRASNGTLTTLALAVVADNGGSTAQSQIQVLSLLSTGEALSSEGPVLATWTTPGPAQGFVGAPALLGQRGGNLTFVAAQQNGTLAIFRYSVNGTGTSALAVVGFVPYAPPGAPFSMPDGSPVVNAGEGGVAYLALPGGQLEALSLSSRSILWTYQGSSGFLGSPAVASTRLYATDANGTLHALGTGSTPPGATRLLLSPSPLPWIAGGDRTNLTVKVSVWYANGSQEPAAGAVLTLTARLGNVSGSPNTTTARGVANLTFGAPDVSAETNDTLYLNATWGLLSNRTSFSTVLVPPRLVNNTPVWIVPEPPPPPSLVAGESANISFVITVGPDGPPLVGALADLEAFGGVVTPTSIYTGATGTVNATFVAGAPTAGAPTSGLTVTVEKAGYRLGTYSWVTQIVSVPQLLVQFQPDALLLVAGSTATFQVSVNSTEHSAVANAVVEVALLGRAGNLSSDGGPTNGRGVFEATYSAPSHVPWPGVSTFVEVTVAASGFQTWSGALPVTLVGNASAPASSGQGNPLASLSAAEGWSVVGVLVALVLLVLLLIRRRRPEVPGAPSVWAERGEGPSESEEGGDPAASGRRGASEPGDRTFRADPTTANEAGAGAPEGDPRSPGGSGAEGDDSAAHR